MEFFATDQGRLLILAAATALVAIAFWVLRATRAAPRRRIRVVGIGGAGANAIDAMKRAGLRGVDYVAVNTDVGALNRASTRTKIVIGRSATGGLGAGGDVGVGESAAREAAEAIGQAIDGSDLVVIVAGLGGGTGSGAAPVVAEIAGGRGVLTVAVVTKPFAFEGSRKARVAQDAEAALAGLVDAVATIPNDQVRDGAPTDVTVEDAFRAIDEAVHRSVAEVIEMVAVPGRINLDFADVRAVLRGGGAAAMGFGRAAGENRAADAASEAIATTRLDERIQGARSVLVNVSGSRQLRLSELDAVAETILAATGSETNLVFGVSVRPDLREELQVTVVATGTGVADVAPKAVATPPTVERPAEPAPVPPTKAVAARMPPKAVDAPVPPSKAAATPEPPKAVASPASTPPKVSVADLKATIAPPPDPEPARAVEADPQPAEAFDEDPDEWKPVWLRRAAPPNTPAPDSGTHMTATPKAESRRSRRRRGRSTQSDEG
jgi:cell division protein FtsZ